MRWSFVQASFQEATPLDIRGVYMDARGMALRTVLALDRSPSIVPWLAVPHRSSCTGGLGGPNFFKLLHYVPPRIPPQFCRQESRRCRPCWSACATGGGFAFLRHGDTFGQWSGKGAVLGTRASRASVRRRSFGQSPVAQLRRFPLCGMGSESGFTQPPYLLCHIVASGLWGPHVRVSGMSILAQRVRRLSRGVIRSR